MSRLKSLREFLDALREIGELQEIDAQVDWNLEMGAITRRSMDLRALAPYSIGSPVSKLVFAHSAPLEG
jgi:4-hydroxy-3-polyprenylbenzoate decarboxylase